MDFLNMCLQKSALIQPRTSFPKFFIKEFGRRGWRFYMAESGSKSTPFVSNPKFGTNLYSVK